MVPSDYGISKLTVLLFSSRKKDSNTRIRYLALSVNAQKMASTWLQEVMTARYPFGKLLRKSKEERMVRIFQLLFTLSSVIQLTTLAIFSLKIKRVTKYSASFTSELTIETEKKMKTSRSLLSLLEATQKKLMFMFWRETLLNIIASWKGIPTQSLVWRVSKRSYSLVVTTLPLFSGILLNGIQRTLKKIQLYAHQRSWEDM